MQHASGPERRQAHKDNTMKIARNILSVSARAWVLAVIMTCGSVMQAGDRQPPVDQAQGMLSGASAVTQKTQDDTAQTDTPETDVALTKNAPTDTLETDVALTGIIQTDTTAHSFVDMIDKLKDMVLDRIVFYLDKRDVGHFFAACPLLYNLFQTRPERADGIVREIVIGHVSADTYITKVCCAKTPGAFSEKVFSARVKHRQDMRCAYAAAGALHGNPWDVMMFVEQQKGPVPPYWHFLNKYLVGMDDAGIQGDDMNDLGSGKTQGADAAADTHKGDTWQADLQKYEVLQHFGADKVRLLKALAGDATKTAAQKTELFWGADVVFDARVKMYVQMCVRGDFKPFVMGIQRSTFRNTEGIIERIWGVQIVKGMGKTGYLCQLPWGLVCEKDAAHLELPFSTRVYRDKMLLPVPDTLVAKAFQGLAHLPKEAGPAGLQACKNECLADLVRQTPRFWAHAIAASLPEAMRASFHWKEKAFFDLLFQGMQDCEKSPDNGDLRVRQTADVSRSFARLLPCEQSPNMFSALNKTINNALSMAMQEALESPCDLCMGVLQGWYDRYPMPEELVHKRMSTQPLSDEDAQAWQTIINHRKACNNNPDALMQDIAFCTALLNVHYQPCQHDRPQGGETPLDCLPTWQPDKPIVMAEKPHKHCTQHLKVLVTSLMRQLHDPDIHQYLSKYPLK